MSITDVRLGKDSVIIPVTQLLKQSNQRNYRHVIYLNKFHNPAVSVVNILKHYLIRSKQLRESQTQLLISIQKPYRAVSKDTIARWIRMVMIEAGIDVNVFKAHSTRAASTSAALRNYIPIEQILKNAGWSNCNTF